jgi:hypothetical protein
MGFFDKTKQTDGASSYPKKLSPDFSGALRTFSFWIANGTVGHPLLEGIDFSELNLGPYVVRDGIRGTSNQKARRSLLPRVCMHYFTKSECLS